MSKLLESGEMYLEHILLLKQKQAQVRAVDVAAHAGYSKPSVSRAMGLLREDGMIVLDEKGYISLTEKGEAVAQKIYRRHLLLSDFFEHIGVDAETADADACRIEHFISDLSVQKIEEHLKALQK
ncbi:MAG: metal-dependent transcriptional regulator [Clostridia bacterium]|nr:metal-dependent transcriptional regulator [Clostridia bacterium]